MRVKVYSSRNLYDNLFQIDILIPEIVMSSEDDRLSKSEFYNRMEDLAKFAVDYIAEAGYRVDPLAGSPYNTENSISYYIYFYAEESRNALLINFRISNHPDNNYAGHIGHLKYLAGIKTKAENKKYYTMKPFNFSARRRTIAELDRILDDIVNTVDNFDFKKKLADKRSNDNRNS